MAETKTKNRGGRPKAEPTKRQLAALDELEAADKASTKAATDRTKAMAKAYRAGNRSPDIAARLGISSQAVIKALRAAGVEIKR